MQTIFITGGAGFIGSNYLNAVVPKDPETRYVNLDALTYAARVENVTVANYPNYSFEQVDIRELAALEALFIKYKPLGIINFAAESHVDRSIVDPAIFVSTNVLGTSNLLTLAVQHKVPRFLQISTDEVYGSLGLTDPAFTEESPLEPNNPYSASKAAAELMVRSFHKTFGLNTVITRCSNNYGPNQDPSKLIPLFIAKLNAGETVPLYGDGSNVRDWLHVSDHVRALELVYAKGTAGEVYNIGGGTEMSNKSLVLKLLELTGRDEAAIDYVTDRQGHDFRYAIDATKVQQELGWKPEVDFATGLNVLVNS